MNKKKIEILIIIFIGIILITLGIILMIPKTPKLDTSGYRLIKNRKVEVYSKVKVKDLIKSIDGKVLTNKKINTEKLGKKEIKFVYENKDGKERTGIVNLEVVDEEEPLIWLSNYYSVKVGSNLSLEDDILCADNYDNNPNCRVEGTYDLNTEGEYHLTYIATDSSNNEEKVDFTLNVYNPKPVESKVETESSEPVVTAFNDVVTNYKNEHTEIGIDVSKWQEEIDFKKVKDAGASFVMIRVGSQQGVNGEYVLDPYFKINIENALKNDLKVGIYFYSYADSKQEAIKQAKWVLKQLEGYKISLPIAFDWECYSSFNQMELSIFGLNQVAESFLSTIEKNGYNGMIYGSKNYLNSIWKYHNYDVWLAHYTEETDYDSEYVMWQLCQNGIIDGINKEVDIDILYKK